MARRLHARQRDALIASLASLLAAAPSAAQRTAPSGRAPKLIVFIAVDQMRADYFERFLPQLNGGLGRLYRGGAVFTNAYQDHAITETAPGHSVMLSGRFPAILKDPNVGEVAQSLYNDARKMLDTIIKENWFTANATIGFWPANADGDDVTLYSDEARTKPLATLHTLRQQLERRAGVPNLALADFIAPKGSGVADYIGAFVVTAGIGEEAITMRFKKSNDDYSSIIVKALADRLAEAFAERMHQRVRMEFWGYAADEALSNDDLILEKYQGIRPAPGYPAQPDHNEKTTIFRLLDAERNAGVTLTESLAMWPGSSVSGIYYSHPQSEYFGVGKIERDQVEDYAERVGATVAETERSLASVLNYIPASEPQPPAPADDDITSLPPAQHPPGCGCAIHMRLNMKSRTDARPD